MNRQMDKQKKKARRFPNTGLKSDFLVQQLSYLNVHVRYSKNALAELNDYIGSLLH